MLVGVGLRSDKLTINVDFGGGSRGRWSEMLNFPVSSDKAFILLSLDRGWVVWDDLKIYPEHFHHKFAVDDFLIEIYSHEITFRAFFLGVKLVVCDRVIPNYLGFNGYLVGTTV